MQAASPRPLATEPVALVVSHDGSLLERVMKSSRERWCVEARFDSRGGRDLLSAHDVRLVVIDDAALAESERGWFVDQVHLRAPKALVVYVASNHTPAMERAIRAHGVLYYTSKPLDEARFAQVLGGVFSRNGG